MRRKRKGGKIENEKVEGKKIKVISRLSLKPYEVYAFLMPVAAEVVINVPEANRYLSALF
jgi:hypothetical protein